MKDHSSDETADVTPEDIVQWRSNPVTKLFMEYIDTAIKDSDKRVHTAIEDNEMHEAHLFNSGKRQLEEVLDIPERMIENKKGEVEDDA